MWNYYFYSETEKVDLCCLSLEEARTFYADAVHHYRNAEWFREFGEDSDWTEEHFEGSDEKGYFRGGFCPEV